MATEGVRRFREMIKVHAYQRDFMSLDVGLISGMHISAANRRRRMPVSGWMFRGNPAIACPMDREELLSTGAVGQACLLAANYPKIPHHDPNSKSPLQNLNLYQNGHVHRSSYPKASIVPQLESSSHSTSVESHRIPSLNGRPALTVTSSYILFRPRRAPSCTGRKPPTSKSNARDTLATMARLLSVRVSLVTSILALLRAILTQAAPTHLDLRRAEEKHPETAVEMWIYLTTAGALVLLGGAFAGLTIALMGQDEIYLQVIATSGEGHERTNAEKVLNLLKRGKHWVLVTLLLGNVITNESLPIVLDRSLGGGWQAVLGSTVLIVIFGEIVPQSVCVRFGLPIGAFMAPFVLLLMWIMAPVAWPTAKLLDFLLGEDHGTTYKKAGLKTLVTLHRTLGHRPDERLNKDEVTIISAVLDLKEKPVGSIMTPMEDVFTLSADKILDDDMMEIILSEGYSRIPVYAVDDHNNFIGMLLVKMLITYDPEDCMRVGDFALATLPETRPETSCLDILNFFQQGKSHMVLVSEFPGEAQGALGVVTLEDVIEELIGEYVKNWSCNRLC